MWARWLAIVGLAAVTGSCGSEFSGKGATGGAAGAGSGGVVGGGGGASGSGGAAAAGGTISTGGTSGTGGSSATGGTSGTGGSSATGGTSGTGGSSATGGASGTGGTSATGGTNGGGGTAGTGGCGGGAPGGTLAGAPGLVLWLDGDAGVTVDQATNRVSQWNDASGNGNHLTAGTSGGPEYYPAGLACHGAMRFRVEQPYQLQRGTAATAGTLTWGTGHFLVAVVASFSNAPNLSNDNDNGTLFFKGSISSGFGPGLLTNLYSSSAGPTGVGLTAWLGNTQYAQSTTAYNDVAPRLYAMRRLGDVLEARVNGQVVATQTGVATYNDNGSQNVRIGSLYNGASWRLDGFIAEVVVVRQDGAMTQVAAVESYLMSKYGL